MYYKFRSIVPSVFKKQHFEKKIKDRRNEMRVTKCYQEKWSVSSSNEHIIFNIIISLNLLKLFHDGERYITYFQGLNAGIGFIDVKIGNEC